MSIVAPTPGSVPNTPPEGAVLTTALVRDALAQHLADALQDLGKVHLSRRIPIMPDEPLPVFGVYALRENKRFVTPGGGAWWYSPNVSIIVTAQVDGEDEKTAEDGLDACALRIEEAVLRDTSWAQPHWGLGDVRKETDIVMDNDRPIGRLMFAFEVTVQSETFEPVIRDELRDVGLRVDTTDPADNLGTYPGQPAEAPRLDGPDGRVEIGADLELPGSTTRHALLAEDGERLAAESGPVLTQE